MPVVHSDWLQTVACVLSFSPPGLLLVATSLRLRKIPVSGTLDILQASLRRVANPAGQRICRENDADKGGFPRQLRTAIDRCCRRGEDPSAVLHTMENMIIATRTTVLHIKQLLLGVAARTVLAVAFTEVMTIAARWLQPDFAFKLKNSWLGAAAAGCLSLAGSLPLLAQIRKAADLVDFSRGNTANQWLHAIRDPHGVTWDRDWRDGIAIEGAALNKLRYFHGERIGAATACLIKAERLAVIYEMMALLPATALLALSRFC